MPKIWKGPRNAKDVLKLFPSYDKNIYNICLKYYFKCAQDMSKIPIPKICLRYVQYMLYIEARYAGDKLSNYHEFLYIYNQTSYNIWFLVIARVGLIELNICHQCSKSVSRQTNQIIEHFMKYIHILGFDLL